MVQHHHNSWVEEQQLHFGHRIGVVEGHCPILVVVVTDVLHPVVHMVQRYWELVLKAEAA